MKVCRICKQEKEAVEFVKNKAFKSGVDTICLMCSRQRVKAWRAAGNRDSAAESRRYYERHSGKVLAKSRAYQLRKQRAMPQWADSKELENIYVACPKGHHVDHIVPLKGEVVCGLHVPWNLQYLPAAVNCAKRNNFNG